LPTVQKRYNRFKSRAEVRTYVGRLLSRLNPPRSSQKAVTPGSVKVFMLVEAGIIGFLSYWVISEYLYNAYFRGYVEQVLLSHGTSYTAVLGLAIGLAGSAVAATLYKNLQHAKRSLETVAVPRIRGAVEKMLSNLPGTEAHPTTNAAEQNLPLTQASESPPMTAIVPVPEPIEQKKDSS
jgi:hypothetical protein